MRRLLVVAGLTAAAATEATSGQSLSDSVLAVTSARRVGTDDVYSSTVPLTTSVSAWAAPL